MNQPVVRGNDWRSLDVPELGNWTPTKTVTVLMLAWQPTTLDTVLAALAAQTYPADLMEVLVVDDGNTPPLELPEIRPNRTRVVRVTEGWGCANGVATGFAEANGEIVVRLDDDMLAFADHVEAHARWHHVIDHAVVLGTKRFVDPEVPLTPAQVRDAVADRSIETLHDWDTSEPHTWIERIWASTDDLTLAGPNGGRSVVGATLSMTRTMYEATGGLDRTVRTGEDTLLGHLLAQAGAVFVPEHTAKAWHLGLSHVMQDADAVNRYNAPVFADMVPVLRPRRQRRGRVWAVPHVEVVLRAEGDLVSVQKQVDAVLDSEFDDLRVVLVGDWQALTAGRGSARTDPMRDLGILHRSYRNEPRVELVEPDAPVLSARCRSPFRLWLRPGDLLPSAQTLRAIVGDLERTQAGLRIFVDDAGREVARAESTAALARAVWHDVPAEELDDFVAHTHGAATRPAVDIGWVPAADRVVRTHPSTPYVAVSAEESWALVAQDLSGRGRRKRASGPGAGASPARASTPARASEASAEESDSWLGRLRGRRRP